MTPKPEAASTLRRGGERCATCGQLEHFHRWFEAGQTHPFVLAEPAPQPETGEAPHRNTSHGGCQACNELIAALRAALAKAEGRLKSYEPVHLYNGCTIDEWKAEAERLSREAQMWGREATKERARADAAEAHAKELYEESLDVARRHKKEIDAAEARVAELEKVLREIDESPYGNDGAVAAHRIAATALGRPAR